MKKSLENKIRIEAVIICIIVAFSIVTFALYINHLKMEIELGIDKIHQQKSILSTTNNLIVSVSKIQSLPALYISTKDEKYLKEYNSSIKKISILTDSLSQIEPEKSDEFKKIISLLKKQSQNSSKLSTELNRKNPIAHIRNHIINREPDTLIVQQHIINVKNDTIIEKRPKKSFFKRLGNLFNPSEDSLRVIVEQKRDTLKTFVRDSITLYSEIQEITELAQLEYDDNIKKIEQEVSKLIVSYRDVSSQLSEMLILLHKESLASTLEIVGENEKKIQQNYLICIIGGIAALLLTLLFIALIIIDINKGYRVRMALVKANEDKKQIMESRHKLLLAVSHDIKSPLNSIIGYLSLMEKSEEKESMESSSRHILSMLENLLEFSAIEQGKLQLNITCVNINEVCHNIYDMFKPLCNEKSLQFDYSCDNIFVASDEMKIKQMLINLISNAIKYTDEGGVKFSILYDKGVEKIKLKVCDSGAGIPIDKQDMLFKPFSRIEENNHMAKGNGLGMYIVKGLVESMEGEINFESRKNLGTNIQISIPAIETEEKISSVRRRIKIFEDDVVTKKVVTEMVLKLGHIIDQENPDTIITDMEMGNLSGNEVLKNNIGRDVILMSGRMDITKKTAMEMGFSAFLSKPFAISNLRSIIGEYNVVDDFATEDMSEIIELFKSTTVENFKRLNEALKNDNFEQAYALCHKMYPMFAQLNYPSTLLRKMDEHRCNPYNEWQKDVEKILSITI